MYAGAMIWRQIRPVQCLGQVGRILAAKFSSTNSSQIKMPATEVDTPMETAPLTPSKKIKLDSDAESVTRPPVLKFAKLTENAFTPTRGSKLAAGYDLYSAYDCEVPAKGKQLIKTDIQIAVPHGCYGRVAPRSGLAHKHFIDVGAGVIDEDYRGNVGVILFNFGEKEFKVTKGDRVAQLIMERIYLPKLEELKSLDETDRGEGGFGSTGVKLGKPAT